MITGERRGRWASSAPPVWTKPKRKPWHEITPRTDPAMRFTSSHAVAEAYACNDEELAMFGRIVAADTAVEAGIVFA